MTPNSWQPKPYDPNDPNLRLIPLTQGKSAVVDAIDYEWLMQWEWQAMRLYKGDFYAGRTEGNKPNQKTIFMARQIMGFPEGKLVDHMNGTLDNRRIHLRCATHQQNVWNSKPQNGRRFKGVFWHKQVGKWRAMIRVNRKLICLGLHVLEESAARAYDAAAIFYFGEFAKLNFPAIAEQVPPSHEYGTMRSLPLVEDF
jgi:hypothetical protein